MIITAISSIVLTSLGKNYFENKDTALTIAAVIFSSMLFIIGWLGDRQKPLNPAFEKEEKHQEKTKDKIILEANEKLLAEKITTLLEKEKVYLNSKLNIIDIASKIGTNRSYISSLINKKFDQNFCCFVNQYRIKELEQRISNEPNTSYHILAEECGFGSVDSMKRSVKAKTGMNMKEWKESFR
jgi:AraC-like DNA-binding protein